MYFRTRRRTNTVSGQKVKHIVDSSTIGSNLSLGNNAVTIVEAVDNPVIANTFDAATGSIIKAVHFEINVSSISGVQVLDWYLQFLPAGQTTNPNPTAVGSDNLKDYIFHQGMEMLTTGTPSKKIGFIKIPKKWQKLHRGDSIEIVYRSRLNLGANDCFCFKAIYLEFRT